LDDAMRARGASGPAYETIVASGPNAALPHARPTDRAFSDGDLVIIDAGAVVDGYRSDMTRTFVVGEPSAQAREMLDVVTRSQAAGVAGVGGGVEAGVIDALCREVIDAARMGDAFIHGTGHGVGLDIHELPRVRKGSTAILRPGHVLTVEPGVYYPGVGGVRVEDTVVVTEDGCRALTRFPKSPCVSRSPGADDHYE
jgi:Xaa-Pro aminopeptidase